MHSPCQDHHNTIHSQGSQDLETLHQEPYSFSTTRNVLEYVVRYHKSFSYASLSQHQTPKILPNISCDAKITTPPFTHKNVKTWKNCGCSPTAFFTGQKLIEYVVQYHRTFSYAFLYGPTWNLKRNAYHFMWCPDHHITNHSQNSNDLKIFQLQPRRYFTM